jgi:dCTP deaminase
MILKGSKLAKELQSNEADRLRITPPPDLSELKSRGAASIDLRLGRWFLTMRQARVALLHMGSEEKGEDSTLGQTKEHFVPFGTSFILHPSKFVLGISLEWVKLPAHLAGYVTGKSSWARRGLIIETAAGIHPGFSGCIALEMTNIGEIPIEIVPGTEIGQLFLHNADGDKNVTKSQFGCQRKPKMGIIQEDEVLKLLKGSL